MCRWGGCNWDERIHGKAMDAPQLVWEESRAVVDVSKASHVHHARETCCMRGHGDGGKLLRSTWHPPASFRIDEDWLWPMQLLSSA